MKNKSVNKFILFSFISAGILLIFSLFPKKLTQSKNSTQIENIQIQSAKTNHKKVNINPTNVQNSALTSDQLTEPIQKPIQVTANKNNFTQNFFKKDEALELAKKNIEFVHFNMPKLSSFKLKKDSAQYDVHDTPDEILKAGELLANLHHYFTENKTHFKTQMEFYLDCSQNKEYFDSARALCAARLSKLYKEQTGQSISSLVFENRIAILKDQIDL